MTASLLVGFSLGLRRLRCRLFLGLSLGGRRRGGTLGRDALLFLPLRGKRAGVLGELRRLLCQGPDFLSIRFSREGILRQFQPAFSLRKDVWRVLFGSPRFGDLNRVTGLVHFERNVFEIQRQRQGIAQLLILAAFLQLIVTHGVDSSLGVLP